MAKAEKYVEVCSFKLEFNPGGISGKHCCTVSKESEIKFKILSAAEAEIKCKFCGHSIVFVYFPGMNPVDVRQNIEHTLCEMATKMHDKAQDHLWDDQ